MLLKNIFDKIVIINLDRRVDRLKLIIENLKIINLSIDDCNVFSAVDSLTLAAFEMRELKIKKGAYACSCSYKKIFEEFLLTDLQTLVIMEDDCAFLKDFDYNIFMDIPENWDLLYFGANNNVKPILCNKHWNKVVKSLSSHMIVYSRKAIALINNYLQKEEIIKTYEYDIILSRFIQCNHSFITKDIYAYQTRSYSDIEMKIVDYSWMLK